MLKKYLDLRERIISFMRPILGIIGFIFIILGIFLFPNFESFCSNTHLSVYDNKYTETGTLSYLICGNYKESSDEIISRMRLQNTESISVIDNQSLILNGFGNWLFRILKLFIIFYGTFLLFNFLNRNIFISTDEYKKILNICVSISRIITIMMCKVFALYLAGVILWSVI